jgi:hypothetical protein
MLSKDVPAERLYDLQKYLAIGNRGYNNEVRLHGLLKFAKAGLVCIASD